MDPDHDSNCKDNEDDGSKAAREVRPKEAPRNTSMGVVAIEEEGTDRLVEANGDKDSYHTNCYA